MAAAAGLAVEIETRTGTRGFDVERVEARTRPSAAGGEHRKLFVFPAPKIASFWTEGTAVPIDMIFVRADGRIARIAADVAPLSRAPVSSIEPVIAVIEIAGGRAAALGIREGDRVSWPGGPRLNGDRPSR